MLTKIKRKLSKECLMGFYFMHCCYILGHAGPLPGFDVNNHIFTAVKHCLSILTKRQDSIYPFMLSLYVLNICVYIEFRIYHLMQTFGYIEASLKATDLQGQKTLKSL